MTRVPIGIPNKKKHGSHGIPIIDVLVLIKYLYNIIRQFITL